MHTVHHTYDNDNSFVNIKFISKHTKGAGVYRQRKEKKKKSEIAFKLCVNSKIRYG